MLKVGQFHYVVLIWNYLAMSAIKFKTKNNF